MVPTAGANSLDFAIKTKKPRGGGPFCQERYPLRRRQAGVRTHLLAFDERQVRTAKQTSDKKTQMTARSPERPD
jgi:hypothetical protein